MCSSDLPVFLSSFLSLSWLDSAAALSLLPSPPTSRLRPSCDDATSLAVGQETVASDEVAWVNVKEVPKWGFGYPQGRADRGALERCVFSMEVGGGG